MSYRLAQEIRERQKAAANGFERTARARKVAALAAAIDKVRRELPAMSDERAAEWVRNMGREDRARLHLMAAIKRPSSDETWALLVEATRNRTDALVDELATPGWDNEDGGSIR